MKTVMTGAVLALLAAASAPTAHAVEVSYFLKIPGVEGGERKGARFDRLELGDLDGSKRVTHELSGCNVTSYSINGSGLDDASIPTEILSLNFSKITRQ